MVRHSYGSMQFRQAEHPRQDYHVARPGEPARLLPPPTDHAGDDLAWMIAQAHDAYLRAQERARVRRVLTSLALIGLVVGSVVAAATAWASVLR